MNIFKTFEILLSEPLSIIRKRIIHILHVETNIFANHVPIEFDMNENSTQITVYNNQKMYNILSTVVHKKQMQQKNNEAPVAELGILQDYKLLPKHADREVVEMK